MVFPIERTGDSIWVVRVEYTNGNRMYFGFQTEEETKEFRSRLASQQAGQSIRRLQGFSVPICKLVSD